jgi:nucleoside-diphosphate-sugar epimerase
VRVFVTGATGFIGSAIVRELTGAGHQVLGLARSDAAADALARAGFEAHRGDLTDTESLSAGARACDGVVHTAFIHDFSQYAANGEIDRLAIEAIGAALAGSGRPLVTTSGTAMTAFMAPGRLATEEDAPPVTVPRVGSEEATLSKASLDVRASVVRLPPTVHGDGDQGFVPQLITTARETGISAYVSDGLNRWPAVHRLDAAVLYRLALESGLAGARYHGVADEGVPTREIAGVIGRRLNLPVVAKSPAEATDHFGFVGMIFGMDCPASSARTREQLGWRPAQPGLIADLDGARYFET